MMCWKSDKRFLSWEESFSCWLFRLWCAGNGHKDYDTPESVSVAGCLGYDVLVDSPNNYSVGTLVSVAGCLGYDVLGSTSFAPHDFPEFQLLVV